MKIYNTLTRRKEELVPIKKGEIEMYTCGPTVYWRVHIGNLRTYVASDILSRTLRYIGCKVKRIINFTDVGHMTADEDFGEDKIEKQAKIEKKSPLELANFYIDSILADFQNMNIQNPNGTEISKDINAKNMKKTDWAELGWARATDYIEEMISLIKKIEANGYTYETEQAVYFDVAKFTKYTEFSQQKLEEKITGAREEVQVDPDKKHPADFVLWMKSAGPYKTHLMQWDSPWGKGFPGWHIECSAMAAKFFGDRFDIHTGGTDHIAVHHTNEIAQNFGAFQHKAVNYWIHNEMLVNKEGGKLSKSKKNVFFLDEIESMGFEAMDLRYYFLTVNYRMPLPFSIEGLESAKNARRNLLTRLSALYSQLSEQEKESLIKPANAEIFEETLKKYANLFQDAIEDNLNTAKALSSISELLKSELKPFYKLLLIGKFDEVLGLRLIETVIEKSRQEIPEEYIKKLAERQKAKQEKDFKKADKIREQIQKAGYEVIDMPDGSKLIKKE